MNAAVMPRAPRDPGRRVLGRALRRWLVGCLLGASAASLPAAAAERADEASVHAAYVINFLRYTRWPGPESPSHPRVIAVVGPAEDAAALEALARRAGPIEGRAILVLPVPVNAAAPSRAEAAEAMRLELAEVHVVYVSRSHRAWNRAVIAATAGRPVLTVGVESGFVGDGGMFELFRDEGRVLFRANEPAIRTAAIEVSARVMVLARPPRLTER